MGARRLVPVAVFCVGACATPRTPAPPVSTVRVEARKFSFTPSRIRVPRGATVSLEVVSKDVVHGFSIPDLDIRADVVPGQVTRIALDTTRAGSFPLHCDVFCGDGHEDMTGTVEVTP